MKFKDKNESVNYLYHKFAGYMLFPFRFTGVVLATLGIVGINVVLDGLRLNSKTLFTKTCLGYTNICVRLCGLQVFVEGEENLTDNPCIIIGNHINLYDHYVMTYIQQKIPSFVASDKYNIYPFSSLISYTKSIVCNKEKNTGVVNKIKQYVQDGNQVTMYPDGCNIIPKGYVIAPFRSGAFVPKLPIQPIVIKYLSSSTKNIHWNHNSLLSLLTSYLLDGDIRCFVKILPVQQYKERYKSHDDYRESIYYLMQQEFKTLPKERSLWMNEGSSGEYTMNALLMLLSAGIISFLLGNYFMSCESFLSFIVGYFCHFYPTQNTRLFDISVISYVTIRNYFASIYGWTDFYIRLSILGVFSVFVGRWFNSSYTEKEHIHYVWIPGYIMGLYPFIVNTLELYNMI
tara:strand:+ start:74 stop:1276 length:1203 start_codon:yes stop_codon:yes gene_type:complete